MKQLLCLILTAAILFSLSACHGNFAGVNLQDPVNIPSDGVVDKATIQQIKDENAIAVFVGSSGELRYEWTVFGSAIQEAKTVNLGVQLETTQDGYVVVTLNTAEPFGFAATLAIYLKEHWEAYNATAYAEGTPIASVSLTGSKGTILNVALNGGFRNFVIQPDPVHEDPVPDPAPTEPESQPAEPEPTEPETEPTQPEVNVPPTEPPTEPPTTPTGSGEKDKYFTDPVPEGKPNPVEPEDQEVDKNITYTCIFSIECSTILNNLDMLDPDKLEMVPYDGVILAKTTVTFYEGESVFDVLQRLCKEKGIHMEAEWTPIYNSAYIEGIHNLYEFDCGALSGWMYKVNDWYPNYGCSRYQLADGDVVEWRYTCDLGNDVGGGYAVGG